MDVAFPPPSGSRSNNLHDSAHAQPENNPSQAGPPQPDTPAPGPSAAKNGRHRTAQVQTNGIGDISPALSKPHKFTGSNRPQQRLQNNRHLFGLLKNDYYHQQDMNDDYEQRFPEDPIFEEASENARVWRMYLIESAIFDENMVGEARDGLDALLVFAGLFSAVVISFVAQTTQNLQLSSSDISAALLVELVAIHRAAAAGVNVTSVPQSMLTPTTKFVPASSLDVWVNVLWVVSLVLALVVALASVLVKQWLHRYIAVQSGTPKDRSHVRQFRYKGFREWQVLNIIGALPVIMHLSLLLFFLGLVLHCNWPWPASSGLPHSLCIASTLSLLSFPLSIPNVPTEHLYLTFSLSLAFIAMQL
ncbi:hypothetical protein BDP27DRAFT_822769 [Rhodocollybia butyracea]|uniref:DUF6535 domain-containing protein n=1 Tax=Rhodocollybia butyracea TaxID=206335 RepID=A0A9P5U613_9AGAR|nr:hypothetical protein BDP27DRAFT_822769 [Rhodocollybia butyracea]